MQAEFKSLNGYSLSIASITPDKYINFVPKLNGDWINQEDDTAVTVTLYEYELARLRDILNELDLPPIPPQWDGVDVTSANQLLSIAVESGEGASEDFLKLAKDLDEYLRKA